MQIPHYLIQRRRKSRINIQKHTLPLANPQPLPQPTNHRLKALRRRDSHHRPLQRGRTADGAELHGDLWLGEVGGVGEGRGGVAGEVREDHGGGHC